MTDPLFPLISRLDLSILSDKITITHDKQQNAFDETDDRRNERPAEQKIGNAPPDPAEIELMDTEPTQEEREQRRNQFALPVRCRGNVNARGRHLAYAAFRTDLRSCLDDGTALGAEFLISSFLSNLGHGALPGRSTWTTIHFVFAFL